MKFAGRVLLLSDDGLEFAARMKRIFTKYLGESCGVGIIRHSEWLAHREELKNATAIVLDEVPLIDTIEHEEEWIACAAQPLVFIVLLRDNDHHGISKVGDTLVLRHHFSLPIDILLVEVAVYLQNAA